MLSGGVQNLDSGTTTGTTISAGGTQNVAAFGFGDYGTAIGTMIASGGSQVLGTFEGDQGTAISTTILSGGVQDIAEEGGAGTALAPRSRVELRSSATAAGSSALPESGLRSTQRS